MAANAPAQDQQTASAGNSTDQWIARRAHALFSEHSTELWRQADRRFFWLFLFQWLAGIAIASLWLPRTWQGALNSVQLHLGISIGIGSAIVALPVALTWFFPGKAITRQVVAISQMLFGVLILRLTGGRTETQFYIFGSLAFLALYRDWKIIATATFVIISEHAVRAWFSPGSLSLANPGNLLRLLEFSGWVAFEDIFLLMSIFLSLREMQSHGQAHARVEALMNLALSDSKQEADTIMATVNQGLFLLGSNFRIGANYSKALESILESEQLQNQDFLQLLRRMAPEGVFATAKDYLSLMFDIRKREKQLTKLNPLTELEVQVTSPSGGFVSKHLEFRFSRVVREEKVSHLLVAVTDVTDRVRLQEKLKHSEEGKEKQFDLLLGILHVEPAVLQEFIHSTRRSLNASNEAFKLENMQDGGVSFKAKLEYAFREVHSIKGNASLLQLEYFENRTHEIEDKIVELQRRPELSGEDFLPVVLAQSDLSRALDDVATLIERLVHMHRSFSPRPAADNGANPAPSANSHPHDHVLQCAAILVDSLSAKLGKEATFVCADFQGKEIPTKHRELFKEILAQLVRNSLAHGIEAPEERVSYSKEPGGLIELIAPEEQSLESFEFIFRDDGRGLNSRRLQSKAIELGLVSSEEVDLWDSSRIAALIFEPGFSTAAQITSDAGRGVGMDIIKSRVVDELGGEIRINSAPGQFCEFHFILPN